MSAGWYNFRTAVNRELLVAGDLIRGIETLWNEEAKAKGDLPAITTSVHGVTGMRLEGPDDSCDRVPAAK